MTYILSDIKETKIRHRVYILSCAQMLKLLSKNETESQKAGAGGTKSNPKHDKLLKCYPLGQHDAISNILCLALSVLAETWLHSLKVCARPNIWQQSGCGSSLAT